MKSRHENANETKVNIPKKRKKKQSGKLLPKLLIGLIAVFLISGAVGIYFNQEEQIARIKEREKELSIEVQKARNEKLENEELFKKLDSLEYIEKMAREKLGMIKPGETVFPDK